MAPQVRGTPTRGGYASFSTSRAVTVPTGAQAGDIAIVGLSLWVNSGTPTPTATGFQQLGTTLSSGFLRHYVFWKRLTANDTGSYTFSWSGSAWNGYRCFIVSGAVSEGNPIVDFSQAASTSGNVPSLSVTADDPLLVWMIQVDSVAVTAYPTGFTGGFNDATSADDNSGGGAYRIPGSNGTHTASGAAASAPRILTLLAVAPEPSVEEPMETGGATLTLGLGLAGAGSVPVASVPSGEAQLALGLDLSGSGSVPTASVPNGGAALSLGLGLSGSGSAPAVPVGSGGSSLALGLDLAGQGSAPTATVPSGGAQFDLGLTLAGSGEAPTATVPRGGGQLVLGLDLTGEGSVPTPGVSSGGATLTLGLGLTGSGSVPVASVPSGSAQLDLGLGLDGSGSVPTATIKTGGAQLALGLDLRGAGEAPNAGVERGGATLTLGLGLTGSGSVPSATVLSGGSTLTLGLGLNGSGSAPSATVQSGGTRLDLGLTLSGDGRNLPGTVPVAGGQLGLGVSLKASGSVPKAELPTGRARLALGLILLSPAAGPLSEGYRAEIHEARYSAGVFEFDYTATVEDFMATRWHLRLQQFNAEIRRIRFLDPDGNPVEEGKTAQVVIKPVAGVPDNAEGVKVYSLTVGEDGYVELSIPPADLATAGERYWRGDILPGPITCVEGPCTIEAR